NYIFYSSRRRHTRLQGDWSSDVCSSDLPVRGEQGGTIEESIHEGRLEILFVESCADRRDHHGIHDEGERGPMQLPRDGPDDRGRSEERRVGEESGGTG